jgi:hypothetical protein
MAHSARLVVFFMSDKSPYNRVLIIKKIKPFVNLMTLSFWLKLGLIMTFRNYRIWYLTSF